MPVHDSLYQPIRHISKDPSNSVKSNDQGNFENRMVLVYAENSQIENSLKLSIHVNLR